MQKVGRGDREPSWKWSTWSSGFSRLLIMLRYKGLPLSSWVAVTVEVVGQLGGVVVKRSYLTLAITEWTGEPGLAIKCEGHAERLDRKVRRSLFWFFSAFYSWPSTSSVPLSPPLPESVHHSTWYCIWCQFHGYQSRTRDLTQHRGMECSWLVYSVVVSYIVSCWVRMSSEKWRRWGRTLYTETPVTPVVLGAKKVSTSTQ